MAQTNWVLERVAASEEEEFLHVLNSGITTIGRQPKNNIVCRSAQVSRHHCDITLRDSNVYIKDRKSCNGTFIGSERLISGRDVQIIKGDVIGIGTDCADTKQFVYQLKELSTTQVQNIRINRKRKASTSPGGLELKRLCNDQKPFSRQEVRRIGEVTYDYCMQPTIKVTVERLTAIDTTADVRNQRLECEESELMPRPPLIARNKELSPTLLEASPHRRQPVALSRQHMNSTPVENNPMRLNETGSSHKESNFVENESVTPWSMCTNEPSVESSGPPSRRQSCNRESENAIITSPGGKIVVNTSFSNLDLDEDLIFVSETKLIPGNEGSRASEFSSVDKIKNPPQLTLATKVSKATDSEKVTFLRTNTLDQIEASSLNELTRKCDTIDLEENVEQLSTDIDSLVLVTMHELSGRGEVVTVENIPNRLPNDVTRQSSILYQELSNKYDKLDIRGVDRSEVGSTLVSDNNNMGEVTENSSAMGEQQTTKRFNAANARSNSEGLSAHNELKSTVMLRLNTEKEILKRLSIPEPSSSERERNTAVERNSTSVNNTTSKPNQEPVELENDIAVENWTKIGRTKSFNPSSAMSELKKLSLTKSCSKNLSQSEDITLNSLDGSCLIPPASSTPLIKKNYKAQINSCADNIDLHLNSGENQVVRIKAEPSTPSFFSQIEEVVTIEDSEDEFECSQLFIATDDLNISDKQEETVAIKEEAETDQHMLEMEGGEEENFMFTFDSHFSQCSQDEEDIRLNLPQEEDGEQEDWKDPLEEFQKYAKSNSKSHQEEVQGEIVNLISDEDSCPSVTSLESYSEDSVTERVRRLHESVNLDNKAANDRKSRSQSTSDQALPDRKGEKEQTRCATSALHQKDSNQVDASGLDDIELLLKNLQGSPLPDDIGVLTSSSAPKEGKPTAQKMTFEKSKKKSRKGLSLRTEHSERSSDLIHCHDKIISKEKTKNLLAEKVHDENVDLNKDITLPSLGEVQGVKLVKSTLLLTKPPDAKISSAEKKNTVVRDTKEGNKTNDFKSLSKRKKEKMIQERKAKLKTLALRRKSEDRIAEVDDLEGPRDVQEKLYVSNEKKDDAASAHVKMTERNRGSVLLDGFMERSSGGPRRGRSSRKEEDKKTKKTSSSNEDERGKIIGDNTCKAGPEKTRIDECKFLKSCLKKLSISNEVKPKKGVVFRGVEKEVRVYECDGMLLRKVNEMERRDKPAPRPVKTGPLERISQAKGVISTEEALFNITRWNTNWIEECKERTEEPPVSPIQISALPDIYVDYDDYKTRLYPYLLYETWAKMNRSMNEQLYSVSIFHGVVTHVTEPRPVTGRKGELVTVTCCLFMNNQDLARAPNYRDLSLIQVRFERDMGQHQLFQIFSVVNSKYKIYRTTEIVDPMVTKGMTALIKERRMSMPGLCVFFDFVTYRSIQKQIFPGYLLKYRCIYNLYNDLRLLDALSCLAMSPLCEFFLNPIKARKPVVNKHREEKIVSKFPLNEQQKKAVLDSSDMVFGGKPFINIINGPPGTGKTQLIVAMIEQLLFRFKRLRDKRTSPPKILICTKSNAAVDEVVLRLLDLRKKLPKDKRFKLTRFGRHDKMVQDVEEVSSYALAEKQLSTEDYLTDLSLLQAQFQASSEIYANIHKKPEEQRQGIRMKYEQYKNRIEIYEAILNNSLSPEMLSKEKGKLIIKEEQRVLQKADIIATTLSLTCHRKLLESFDEIRYSKDRNLSEIAVCIVDEAQQVTELELLVPLLLDVKSFILVGDPQQLKPCVVSPTCRQLGYQRSLCERLLSSWLEPHPSAEFPLYQLFFQHRMHPEIANYPSIGLYPEVLTTPPFLANVNISRGYRPYGIITHHHPQDTQGDSNRSEADLVLNILSEILSSEVFNGLTITLITSSMKQKNLLGSMGVERKVVRPERVTVQTIDSFHGQESDVILLSCVQSECEAGSQLGLMGDQHRTRTALTRAKRGLLICANLSALQSSTLWRPILENAQSRDHHLDMTEHTTNYQLVNFILDVPQRRRRAKF